MQKSQPKIVPFLYKDNRRYPGLGVIHVKRRRYLVEYVDMQSFKTKSVRENIIISAISVIKNNN